MLLGTKIHLFSVHPRRPGPIGITTIELGAVMAIVAMIMAMSVAAYWTMSRRFKEQGAISEIDVALRQARNSAISANAPAFVEIDTENRNVVPWVYRTVGFWHFEESDSYGRSHGAYHNATLRGAQLCPSHQYPNLDGKIGKCVLLRDGASVDVGSDPDFDLEDGGYLEAYVRPLPRDGAFAGDNYIFSKLNSYWMKIGPGGVLMASAGNKTIKAANYKMVPGRWTKVAFAWDHNSARILVDDCIVGIGAGARPPLSDHPLLIGRDEGSLDGLVDEVRVMTAARGNSVQLPKNFVLTHTAAPWQAIYFSPDGALDMRYHAGPVSVSIASEIRSRTVNISMLGTTTRQEVENVAQVQQPVNTPSRLTVYGDDDKKKTPEKKP